MTAGQEFPTTDTAIVDLGLAASDVAPAYFEDDGGYTVTARIAGFDTVSGDTLMAELKVAVSVVGGVLTIGPISNALPLYAPAFAGLAVTLVQDAANMRVLVEVQGNVGLAGRFADVDVNWVAWASLKV